MTTQKIIFIFVIALTFTLSSCEKDLYDTSNATDSKLIVNTISFKDLKNKSVKLLKIVNKLEQKEKLVSSKMVFDSVNNFYIDEDSIKEIKSGEYESYTLAIKREENNKVENLLFSKNEEGNYDIFIVKYDITAEQLESAKETGFIGDVKYNRYEMDENGLLTNRYMQVICATSGSWQWVSHQSFTTQQPTMYYEFVVSSVSCTFSYDNSNGSSGGNTSSGSTYNNGQTSGSSGNGSNTNNTNTTVGVYGNGGLDGTGIHTVPIAPKMTPREIKIAFTAFLINHPSQLNWWNIQANDLIVKEIVDYLTLNQTYAVDEQTPFYFALNCINQIMQNPTVFTSFKPFVIEKQIDDSLLNPCTKNVVSVIKSLTQNDFATIIAKLGPVNSVYNVSITPVQNLNINTSNLAITSIIDPINNMFATNIQIDSQYLTQGTKLSIATTILHELIHAYFFSLVADEYENGVSILNTFPELWNYYVENNNLTPGGSPQHLVMAQNYIDIMGAAFQEFDTGSPISASNPLQQKYKDLAWGGLYGTTVFNSLSQLEKDRITAINNAEEKNIPQTENGITHLPISTPCN